METVINDISYGLLIWQSIILISIGLWIYSLIDILKNSFEKNDKIVWILVVVLVPLLGSILYIFIGRKRKLKLN
jgi:hypothetical protein